MRDTDIAVCFNACFAELEQTQMIGGAAEPLYLPPVGDRCARLFYREDYAASALHEAAHWCIAGVSRRQQIDFGYVYVEPPRNPDCQQRFFALEVKTQTLECIFAQAVGAEFNPSADNPHADIRGFATTLERIRQPMLNWLLTSAGTRARRFCAALRAQCSLQRAPPAVRIVRVAHGTS